MTDVAVDLSSMVVEVRQRIAASRGSVWDLLADLPAVARHSSEVIELHWQSHGPVRVGSTFQATNELGDVRWTVVGHITRCERPALLEWTVSTPERPSSTWSYELTADGDGDGDGTVVVQRFVHGPGNSGVRAMIGDDPALVEPVVAARSRMLQESMRASLAAVAHAVHPVRPAG